MRQKILSEHEKSVNRVIDYINANLYKTPGIKEISEIANISGFYFHRIFKAVIGENIGEYINRLRLEDIAFRLIISKNTVEEIAFKTNYSTKHALSKAFKKHFGVSPSVYRKQGKNTYPFFGERQIE